mgnify:FL=1
MNGEKLKNKIKKRAKEIGAQPQELMQMYFFERLLYRISISQYKFNFILKGGLLLSAIIGDERRTTSDMDTMIKGIDIESDELLKIIQEIINIKTDDAISFEIEKTKEIRVDDVYGGINIKLIAKKDGLIVPLFIDITTKDPITPREIEFKYKSIFDDEYIKIMAFNKETIIAEKFETLIKDTETNTRAKDFYDLYVLIKEYWNELDKTNLIKAIRNTCKRRESLYILDELEERFDFIKESTILQGEWDKYQIAHLYAKDINYADIMKNINLIIEELAKEVATI